MQIELIDTFLDLAETRSFNRTAQRLGISQSTVSGRVAALEAALDSRLFDRSRAGTLLTTAGQRFTDHARMLRRDWNEALRGLEHSGTNPAGYRIGIQSDLAAAHVSGWLTRLQQSSPDAPIYIEIDYSQQMTADIDNGNLDMAVLFSPRYLPGLYFAPLAEIDYVMISDSARYLAQVEPESYVLANISPAFAAEHRELLPQLITARFGCGLSTAIAGMLQAVGGSAYLARTLALPLVESGRFRLVDDAPVIRQPVFLAMQTRKRHLPSLRRIAAAMTEHFGKTPA